MSEGPNGRVLEGLADGIGRIALKELKQTRSTQSEIEIVSEASSINVIVAYARDAAKGRPC